MLKNRNRILEILCYIGLFACCLGVCLTGWIEPVASAQEVSVYFLKPSGVFDGESAQLHEGWGVLVRGEKMRRLDLWGRRKSPPAPK